MGSFFSKGDRFFGFFRYFRNKKGEVVLRPVWGRVLVGCCALALVGWLSAAFAAFLFVKYQRDFQGGSYVQIVLPWKWDDYLTAWGEEFIERGEEALEEGRFREANHLIRVGHARAPDNLKGRMLMADIHSVFNRPDRAASVLTGGLPEGARDIDYLRKTLQVLLADQRDFEIIELADDLLGEEAVLTPVNQTAALAAARASFYRGLYDQAEDYLLTYELEENREGRILLSRIDWERGNRDEAIERLERQVREFSEEDEIYSLLTRYHREMGNHDRAHRYAVLRQINNPMAPGPRIALLYTHHHEENREATQRGAERFMRDFAGDGRAMMLLAEFAANTRDPELAIEVFRSMDRSGHTLDGVALMVVESHIEAGNFREAVAFLDDHSEADEDFQERHGPHIDGLYTVAYFGLGNHDNAEIHLSRFLASRQMRPEGFLLVSQRIQELGLVETARRVLVHAHERDPRNQAVLTELVTLDLRTGQAEDLPSNIHKLLETRNPSRELLEESYMRLSGDRFLFMQERHDLLDSLEERISVQPGSAATHS